MNRCMCAIVGLFLVGAPVSAQEILILDYGTASNTAVQAATCLGLPFTVVNDDANAAAALTSGTVWDLVIIDNPSNAMPFTTPELVNYVNGGGACILSYWNLDAEPALQAAFEVATAVDFFAPQGFSDSTGGAATEWTAPNDVSTGIPAGVDVWNDNGDLLTASGTAEIIGAFVGGEGAVLRGNGGLTYVVGHDWDSLASEPSRLFLANLIEALYPTGAAACPPFNDECSAPEIVGLDDVRFFSTLAASSDGFAPSCGGTLAPTDVWFQFTAGCDGDFSFDVSGASFSTRIAAWTECPLTGGSELACSATAVTVSLLEGESVQIQVGGQDDLTGSGELTVGLLSGGIVNDLCADAIPLAVGTTAFSNVCAASDGVDPTCSSGEINDIWYTITAPCDGVLTIDTYGSTFDTVLAAWPGGACPVPGDVSLACSDLAGGTLQSEIILNVTTGDEFYIQLGGWDDITGTGVINVECGPVTTTPGDSCALAIDITSTGGGVGIIDLNPMTVSGIDPGCNGALSPDMWFTYTVPCDGEMTAQLLTDFDSTIAVWSGCPAPGDVPLDCQDLPIYDPVSVIAGVIAGETYYIQVLAWGGGAPGTGDLTVSCGAPAITSLACTTAGTEITATWVNPSIYDVIDIYLNGTLVQTVSGGDTSATITGLDPLTSYDVCVEAIDFAGVSAPQVCCAVVTEGDAGGQHVIVNGELPGGLVDSVSALESALLGAGIDAGMISIVPDATAIVGIPASVWVARGTYPDDVPISAAEGDVLLALVNEMVPVYCCGADTFAFDPATAFSTVDGVSDASVVDGLLDYHLGMIGADLFLGLDSTYTQDQAGNEYMDALVVAAPGEDALGDDARVVFTDDLSGGSPLPLVTTIAYYDGAGDVRVISSSSEFGGYDGDKVALIQVMIDAFGLGGTPTDIFRRGDANNDTTFDISDAVFTLSALFVPGSPQPACADAADTNDDTAVDISDAVFTLSALFVPGSPQPPAPGPVTCGEDPTADALDCAVPCP